MSLRKPKTAYQKDERLVAAVLLTFGGVVLGVLASVGGQRAADVDLVGGEVSLRVAANEAAAALAPGCGIDALAFAGWLACGHASA